MSDSTSTSSASPSGEDLTALARAKLTRVLGQERGERVFDATMAAARLKRVDTPDDLYVFAEQLKLRGGIEAAVAGLLGVAAVVRGASSAQRTP